MLIGGVNAWGQNKYVLMDNSGRMLKAVGTTLTGSTSFNPETCVWEYGEYNPSNHRAGFTINIDATTYYLSVGGWTKVDDANIPTKVVIQNALNDYNSGWKIDGNDLKSQGNYYVYWNTDLWGLVKDPVPDNRAKPYSVTTNSGSFTAVSATINGDYSPITSKKKYTFTVTPSADEVNYSVYTFNSTSHFWYNGSDHNALPTNWGTVTVEALTKTWSIVEGGEYASINATNGELTVTDLPTSGSATVKIRCILADNASHSVTVEKSIALEPEMTEISSLSEITNATGRYKLLSDFSTTGTAKVNGNGANIGTSSNPFKGTIDGGLVPITGAWNKPLFDYVEDAVIKNIIIQTVNISTSYNAGAIAATASGATRIYNCGINDGTISGGNNNSVGGVIGKLDGTSHVINCYSYANITGGKNRGGIVGYNSVASNQTSITTMVMNCMFYGDIADGGTNTAPIYGGTNIDNLNSGGLNTFNYYRYESRFSKEGKINKYNCALAMEEKFIKRFERYRLLLNSNKKLAAKYASSADNTVNPEDMAKWVLETADLTNNAPMPYPILKVQGKYPSIINIDAEHATTKAERNEGGLLGTLNVTISSVGDNAPGGASLTKTRLTLNRTDKDYDHYNYNYDKVQLPYYNDVGKGNYTGNRVVTGWEITAITSVENDPYTPSNYTGTNYDYPYYNFADRSSSKKDLYSVSKRIFSQGAYFDVPDGVSSITIKPHWAVATYVSDNYFDVVYKNDYSRQNVTSHGVQYGNNADIDIYGDGNKQKVYTSISNAISGFSSTNMTVYDQAVVLVGNLHQEGNPTTGAAPYTIMSIDMNHDNEPDYSYIFGHSGRQAISPIRYDFLNVVGIAEAQKPRTATKFRNVSIFKPKGWFEITNTCVIHFSQFECDNGGKSLAPIIFLGGTFNQFVSTQLSDPKGHTNYIHVGGNVWFAKFGNGTHSDGSKFTPHIPISVTGGDYDEFYLSGTYQPDITNMADDNAECYISGGRFGEMAGASIEPIHGDVRWEINRADITNFYGGGVNGNRPITGNIQVNISNSHVGRYCGGPKFGDMSDNKTVTTTANDCSFESFFGAGYGGNSYNRVKYFDVENGKPEDYQGSYESDRGKYFDGASTWANSGKTGYGRKGKGVATDFDYEFFVWSSGSTGARFFVQFASFSLATTHNVTSNLTGCTVTGNFYGGGSLGKVDGTATSVLDGCTVNGSVYAGGYSATIPKIPVRNTPAFITGKEPKTNNNTGLFEMGEIADSVEYEWKHVDAMPANNTAGIEIGEGGNFVYTSEDLTTLGQVGSTSLTINNTTVGESVYGGGEESAVNGNTTVTVNSGTIGAVGQGGATYGNVYGGGKGKEDDMLAGLVKGNANVTINQEENKTTRIYHNIYGGGAYGSVGTFTYDETTKMPTALATGNTGACTVTIKGGTIGSNGNENGMVFGSSRGDVAAPGDDGVDPNDRLAWVYSTHVTIGDPSAETSPTIKGSVYGSGENGHTFQNTIVDIKKGIIGIPTGEAIGEYSGAQYSFRGNVYGGGCGTDTYSVTENAGTENEVTHTYYNPLAGIVRGTATVNITGGQVVHNVYGAGAMGSVGNPDDVTSGKTTVNISGGRIGYDGNRNGNVFGAARGEYGISTAASGLASVRESEVNINYATTPAADNEGKTEQLIAGSVFGGGESGLVKGSVAVKMTGGLLLKDIYGGGALADTQTSNWDATANSGAGGWAEGKTAESPTTTVRLTGGTIVGEAYGGGLGEAGKPAYVYGDVLLDLNGTTTSGETGTAIASDARGCVVHEVFGCNNAAGTPMGQVLVHVYATQHAGKSQIANSGDVTDAKTKGAYDVKAVYGGGNLAAYEPYGGKNTTYSTNVIIDGCGLTSIQQVYGGGNAASTPATNVTVNGTYEIEELFGGGNGKDKITVNGVIKDNPGANVGFRDYSAVEDDERWDTKEERVTNQEFINTYVYGSGKAAVNVYGGTIHRVFGGSNTKGNVRQTAVTMLEEAGGCDFCVDEAYGGGKSAPMDAEAKLLMACIPGLQAAYGGAEAADIQGNVTLNITNGTFDRVFGGNNKSGTIRGAITVNIEEVGCRPIIIGELYGGGNQASYSVYGYKQVTEGEGDEAVTRWLAIEDANDPEALTGDNVYANPQVNVKSFTSIGDIYGGGYGDGATMVANPTVNVNVVEGAWKDYVGESSRYEEAGYVYDATGYKGETLTISDGTTTHNVIIPSHAKGKMGAINNIFGGGNAAKVIGNTTLNIATLDEVYVVKEVTVGTALPDGCYTCDSDGKYTAATGTAQDGTTYYEKKDVKGVDIRGNVFGGGNQAEVTGDAKVQIGKKNEGE